MLLFNADSVSRTATAVEQHDSASIRSVSALNRHAYSGTTSHTHSLTRIGRSNGRLEHLYFTLSATLESAEYRTSNSNGCTPKETKRRREKKEEKAPTNN